jgi:hypothetical protein
MNNNQVKEAASPIVEEPPPVVEAAPENLKLIVPKRMFVRKRKNQPEDTEPEPEPPASPVLSPASVDQRLRGTDEAPSHAKQSKLESPQPHAQHEPPVVVETNQKEKEYKKLKLKKSWLEKQNLQNSESSATSLTATSNTTAASVGASSTIVNLSTSSSNNNIYGNTNEPVPGPADGPATDDDQQPSVKLVISKKKGTFFKSRALVDDAGEWQCKIHSRKMLLAPTRAFVQFLRGVVEQRNKHF